MSQVVTNRGGPVRAGSNGASVRLRSAPCAGLLRFPVGTSTGDAGPRPGLPSPPAAGPCCGSLTKIGPCVGRAAEAAPLAAAAPGVPGPGLTEAPAQTGVACGAGRRGSASPVSGLIGLDTSPTAGLLAVGPVTALCVPVSGMPALMPLAAALAACA